MRQMKFFALKCYFLRTALSLQKVGFYLLTPGKLCVIYFGHETNAPRNELPTIELLDLVTLTNRLGSARPFIFREATTFVLI